MPEHPSKFLVHWGYEKGMELMTKRRVTPEMIKRARAHKMTPEERREQRVSLVMGMRGRDSTLTHKKVTTILEEVEGLPA